MAEDEESVMTTRPLSAESGGGCDWGGCDGGAVAERYAADLTAWLPVCDRHTGPTPRRGAYPRGTCPVCGTDHALSTAGLVRAHDRGFAIRCPGSGQPPAPICGGAVGTVTAT